jgi:hypothetical protein
LSLSSKLQLYNNNIILLQHSADTTLHPQFTGYEVWQPNYNFISTYGFQNIINNKFITLSLNSIESKIPQVFWRGTWTGLPFFNNNTRLNLCRYGNNISWINAKITADLNMGFGLSSQPDPYIADIYEPRNVSGDETTWLQYRGIFDIDGFVDSCM